MLSFDSLQHLLDEVGAKPLAVAGGQLMAPLRLSPAGLSRHPPLPAPTLDARTGAHPRRTARRTAAPVDHPEHPPTDAQDLCRAPPRRPATEIREVSPAEADALRQRGGVALIDVREASEWDQGHIPGAAHVSKSYLEQEIEAAAPDRDAPVVLYCAGGVAVAVRGPDARRRWATPTSPR